MTPHGTAARSPVRLHAWVALVGVTTLLAFAVGLLYDVPEDFRYSYWTVLVGVVSSAITLAIVVLIARPGGLRGMLAANYHFVLFEDPQELERGHRAITGILERARPDGAAPHA